MIISKKINWLIVPVFLVSCAVLALAGFDGFGFGFDELFLAVLFI